MSAADKMMAAKLKRTEAKARLDRKRARRELAKAEHAKMKIKLAAKSAIRKAVKNAAIVASVQKKKVAAIAAKERAGKDIGSANTLAAQAKTAAEERLAKRDVRKAQREMARVKSEKQRAFQKLKRVVKKDAQKYAKHSKYAQKAKQEKKQLLRASQRSAKLKQLLKEAHTGTTATTLLHRMYRPLPYEKACGSLTKDPKKMRQTSSKTVGACAAKCASLGKCRSFQFDQKICTLSAKKLLQSSKYGDMLACATKNVLITASMRLATTPTVFEKKMELGESAQYGFETQEDKVAAKSFTKHKAVMAAQHRAAAAAKYQSVTAAGRKAANPGSQGVKGGRRYGKGSSGKAGPASASGCGTSTQVASLQAALRTCRAGIRLVSNRAVEQNRRLVSAAKLQGYSLKRKEDRQLANAKRKLRSKEGKLLATQNRQTTNAVLQVKKAADEQAQKIGKVRQAKSAKAKAIAMQALNQSMKFSKGEKGMVQGAKKMAQKLGKEKIVAAARKVERVGFQRKLKEAKVADAINKTKLQKKLNNLEKREATATAKANAAQQRKNDMKREQKMAANAAQEMAIGMRLKLKQIIKLKKTLKEMTGKWKTMVKKHKKVVAEQHKGAGQLTRCHKNKRVKLKAAKVEYTKSVAKLQTKIQLTNTRSQIVKRALQLCESKNSGSTGRATARVARRTNRAVKRAKRKMKNKQAKKAMKKSLKIKLKAKIKKKLKKKEAKKVSKKAKKLAKTTISPKCKACKKLSTTEHKLLGADCKAC